MKSTQSHASAFTSEPVLFIPVDAAVVPCCNTETQLNGPCLNGKARITLNAFCTREGDFNFMRSFGKLGLSFCVVQNEKKNQNKMSTKCHELPNTEALFHVRARWRAPHFPSLFRRISRHFASISTKWSWYLEFNRTQTNKKPILSTRSVFMSVWNTLFMFTLMYFVSITSQTQLIRTFFRPKRDTVGPGPDANVKRKAKGQRASSLQKLVLPRTLVFSTWK